MPIDEGVFQNIVGVHWGGPVITTISSTDDVIAGKGFGAAPGQVVYYENPDKSGRAVAQAVDSWSDTQIAVTTPNLTPSIPSRNQPVYDGLPLTFHVEVVTQSGSTSALFQQTSSVTRNRDLRGDPGFDYLLTATLLQVLQDLTPPGSNGVKLALRLDMSGVSERFYPSLTGAGPDYMQAFGGADLFSLPGDWAYWIPPLEATAPGWDTWSGIDVGGDVYWADPTNRILITVFDRVQYTSVPVLNPHSVLHF